MFGPRGVLRVGAWPPRVSGANTRRGTTRERTRVRYRLLVTDVWTGSALVASTWSGFIRVRQSQFRTWSSGGPTTFDMLWQGNYGVNLHIQWWNSRRRVGSRVIGTPSFNYFDQYNTGPYGPISSCYKWTSY